MAAAGDLDHGPYWSLNRPDYPACGARPKGNHKRKKRQVERE
jgi:hypothetical protein